jgi:drug/metabolite transporter (DMT)-like permease
LILSLNKSANSSAILLALSAFSLFSVGDALVKSMAGAWPGTAIAALRYLLGTIALLLILWRTEGRSAFVCPRPGLQLGRALAATIQIVSFFAGVQLMPMVEMTTIFFVSPMIVALLSWLVLGEVMTKAAWHSVATGFVGVLLILRPNIADLGWAAILPLVSATGFAVLLILNRRAARLGSAMQMQMLVSVFALPFILLIAVAGVLSGIPRLEVNVPDWTIFAKCVGIAFTGTVSHYMLYKATERLSAPSVAPLTYFQLVVATLLGALFFGDWPDAVSIVGALLIVGAGLYLWWSTAKAGPAS